jgi:hypothetical protein
MKYRLLISTLICLAIAGCAPKRPPIKVGIPVPSKDIPEKKESYYNKW